MKLLLVGDAPNQPSGLARIAKDIIKVAHLSSLFSSVAQLGLYYDGSHWPWHVYGVNDHENWGEKDLLFALKNFLSASSPNDVTEEIVIMTVWDPARCWPISNVVSQLPERKRVRLWGYFAVDSENPNGKIGGPAAAGLRNYDRVLAYGRYGAKVLAKSLDVERVDWLPHPLGQEFGIIRDQGVLYNLLPDFVQGVEGKDENGFPIPGPSKALDPERPLIGCVATNQPRKDLGLFFAIGAALRDRRGIPVQLWLHTDHLYRHWAVQELADVFGFDGPDLYVSQDLSSDALAAMYNVCALTIAPGLGEGFGYPIVESMACGTPVLHGLYAGGAALLPMRSWGISPLTVRYDGAYVLGRPVFDTDAWVKAAHALIDTRPDPLWTMLQVEHLRFSALLPRWIKWFKAGLRETEGEA